MTVFHEAVIFMMCGVKYCRILVND